MPEEQALKIPALNLNSWLIVGGLIASVAAQWALYGNKISDVQVAIIELKATTVASNDQIGRLNVSIGQHEIEIRNLENAFTEWRRQARADIGSIPREFTPLTKPSGSGTR